MSQIAPTRGDKLEGIAFQFCKVATVALIAGKYVLPVASGLCSAFYIAALASGKKDTRCFLREPLLLIALWGAVCAVSIYRIGHPDWPFH